MKQKGFWLILGVLAVVSILFITKATQQKQEVAVLEKEIIQLKEKQTGSTGEQLQEMPKEAVQNEETANQEAERVNQAFLESFFSYRSLENREKGCIPFLTDNAASSLQLSVYNPNESMESAALAIDSYYETVSSTEMYSLNAIKVRVIANGIESKWIQVYQIKLLQEEGEWLIDQVIFVGSRTADD